MLTLADYSVKFGRDPVGGLEGKNAFPFFYSLVNHNDVDWTANATPPDISTYAIRCQENSITPHYVRLDPDYNYKLIAIKYSVYKYVPPNGSAGHYAWYENFNPASLYIPDMLPGSSYAGNIRVSLSIQGSGSTTLFGGQNVQAYTGGAARIPLAVECQQGWEYGFQALRCEYLMPLQAIMSFEFTNTLPATVVPSNQNDLYVAAMMYGLKIRL